ncbi:MAG: hypothetical protein U1F43_24305 [Myxococcota bacterium]
MKFFHAPPLGRARARILSRRPLAWAHAAAESDRTPHPRAASGVVWIGERLAVIQDDASFLALVDAQTAEATSIAMPVGPDGRRRFEPALGNKAAKLDLESAVAWADGATWHWLAFGSGSTAARESVVHACFEPDAEARVRVLPAPALYAALRGAHAFSGDALNVEGAALVGDRLRFFQRGNGAAGPDTDIADATVDVDLAALRGWLAGRAGEPALVAGSARRYALGTLPGEPAVTGPVRLTFTDATVDGDGQVWFLACAEASPNTYDDGLVVGAVVGRMDARGAVVGLARLVDDDGPVALKAEGLVIDRHAAARLDRRRHGRPRARGRALSVDLGELVDVGAG